MNREIVKANTMPELLQLAEILAQSKLFGVQSREQAVAVILTGQDLGLSAAQSLRAIYVVQGKPVLSADAMVAAILASDLCVYWTTRESTNERCIVETQRRGAPSPEHVTWTIEDAARAKITTKDIWKSYPADMLRHRACAVLARCVYPDVVLGVYAPAELPEDDSPQAVTVIQETAPTEPQEIAVAPTPQLPDPIEALQSRIADLGGTVTAEQAGGLYTDLELGNVPKEKHSELKFRAFGIIKQAFSGPAARIIAHAFFALLLNETPRCETRADLEALINRPEVIKTLVRLPFQDPDERGHAVKILSDCAYSIGWAGFDTWIQERILKAGGKHPQPPRGGGAPTPTTEPATPTETPTGPASATVTELRDSIASKLSDPKLSQEAKAFAVGTAYAKRRNALGRHDREGRTLAVDALLGLGSGDEAAASARLDGIVARYDSQQQRRAA